jgi:predicted flavoprotein YhiN
VVITTGGNAYAHTGSSGDGYHLAKALGHTITPLGPSLNSFHTLETRPHELSGIALPQVRFCSPLLKTEGSRGDLGPLLFTHFGITGPNVFSMAAHIPYEIVDKNHPFLVSLIPDASKNFEFWNDILQHKGTSK